MISDHSRDQIIKLLQIEPGERVLLVKDKTTEEIVMPIFHKINQTNAVDLVDLDHYERPLEEIPEPIQELAVNKDVMFYAISKEANEKVSEVNYRRKLNRYVESQGGRVGNMLAPTIEIVESLFNVDVDEVRTFTEEFLEKMKKVKKIRVTTKEGTDATITFDKKYSWLASTGFIKPAVSYNAAPAEIYTYPKNVDGKIVVTGSYGYFSSIKKFNQKKLLARIKKTPITWHVKKGKITKVECEDEELQELVFNQVFGFENADRIGEIGFGTNTGIKELFGVVFHDEKYPGVHIAHGHGYPERTGADYECKIHYDGILLKPTIQNLDNHRYIMKEGKYTK